MHGGGHRWGLAPGSLQLWAGLVLLIGTRMTIAWKQP